MSGKPTRDIAMDALASLPIFPDPEECVAGALLRDNSLIEEVSSRLTPDDFTKRTPQRIFEETLHLHRDRSGAIDMVVLAQRFIELGEVFEDGIPRTMHKIWDAAATEYSLDYHIYGS